MTLASELIMYGGIPMTRHEVYRHALKVTGDRRAADLFAFAGPTLEPTPEVLALRVRFAFEIAEVVPPRPRSLKRSAIVEVG